MPPSSNSGPKAPARSRSDTIVLSKTDALGDQILAIGLANAMLQHRPRARLVWFVRAGNESLASLLKGTQVFRPDFLQPPAGEARKALQGLRMGRSKWARVVFIPVPINPYQEWGRDPEAQMEWWIAFGHSLEATLAAAGSTTRNWLDQVLVASTMATRRIGFGPSPGSQEILPAHRSHIQLGQGQELFTEEIPFPEDLNERQRMHLLAKTVCRKEVPYTITINPVPPAEPIDLVGVDRMLAIAPGVGDPRRAVETASLCDGVADFLNRQAELEKSCLIIEGPLDRKIASEVSAGLRKRGIKTTGLRFDADGLPNLVALLRQVALFLTHETFYVQIAAITKTPTVAIWGLGHWQRFFPEKGRMTIVHTSMPCRNCGWRCCLDRWRCVTDISADAIAEGLSSQWRTRKRTGIRFVESPSPVPDEQVIAKIKIAANSLLRETEKERDQAHAWADDVDKLWRQLQTLYAEVEKQKDEAIRGATEERRRRESAESGLRESQKQRDDYRRWAEEERDLRRVAEALRAEAEKQRDDHRVWAEEERRLRQVAEALQAEAGKQRDDHRAWAEQEGRLRQVAEALRAEAGKQSDDHRVWAELERQMRLEAESLRAEAEKQRDDHRDWAELERQLRLKAESLRTDAEQQRDDEAAWAREEKRLRTTAETLLADAEKQRDDLRAWAEEERELRKSAQELLQAEEEQTLILRSALKETKEVLEGKITMLEETAGQLAVLKEELRQTDEARYRYERLRVCRLAADMADRWNRGKRRMSTK